ncbi:amino acid ABC transporter substrate-binding protein [Pseudomonas yamanorum]|uniref:ABC transporter substrate-binding protein n=1 Tax=Pseudomonas yamanorum TaxID=515393 RepID=UPI0015A46898|nr:ABC transporter substrate-binding protein [Pseudomonas yamanorum]NWD25682.1 amino acid ABC transporter substrate-binding protein [Pseudomonas yamanorum]
MTNKLTSSLVALAFFYGAGAGAAAAADLTGKTIRVGGDLTYPPYDYFLDKKPAGFDPEFMQLLAQAGGFKVESVDTRFENLIIGVSGNKFDVIASALYINPERSKQIAFIPYMKTGISIAVLSTSSFKPLTPEEFCGKRIGFIKGAAYKPKLEQLSKDVCATQGTVIDIREFPSSPEATQALLSGNIDAQTDDSAVIKMAVEKTSGRVIISSKENIYPVLGGLGLNKNNVELKAGLEVAFAKIKADGKYNALLKAYNISEPSSAEVAKVLESGN